jgi:hypothetical protein
LHFVLCVVRAGPRRRGREIGNKILGVKENEEMEMKGVTKGEEIGGEGGNEYGEWRDDNESRTQ